MANTSFNIDENTQSIADIATDIANTITITTPVYVTNCFLLGQ